MSDQATTAPLRSVLDEVCANVSRSGTGARADVALEAANRGAISPEDPKRIGRNALAQVPTMWR
ncbi:MAG: hypothetical protein E6R08_08700 [Nevskiaceae bacterium]|nr:MAG: hypothetical protein E6R08_08700 [Nevskiaceae bacterium]